TGDQTCSLPIYELLEEKITFGDNSFQYDNHSTHIAGIMVGKKLSRGLGLQARGIANKGNVISFDWNNDIREMVEEGSDGLLVSNHSYGVDLTQFPNPEDIAGRYDD